MKNKFFIVILIILVLAGSRARYGLHVDDNGDTGTGYGSINEPTPVKDVTIAFDENGIIHNVAKDTNNAHLDTPDDYSRCIPTPTPSAPSPEPPAPEWRKDLNHQPTKKSACE